MKRYSLSDQWRAKQLGLLHVGEVAKKLGIRPVTVINYASYPKAAPKDFPKWFRHTGRTGYWWKPEDVENYVKEKRGCNTRTAE